MYKSLTVEIVGIAPLIMHNGQLADPLNKYSKMLREVTGKRKKTEADHEEMARIEFVAGLYMGTDGPIIPSRLLEAVVVEGARKSKIGKQAQAAVIIEKHANLVYDGPRSAKELFEDDRFRLSVPVRVGQAKIIRTRPIFHEWSTSFSVSYLDEVINEHDLVTALRNAGMLCGIGDWRPRHGRFALRSDILISEAA